MLALKFADRKLKLLELGAMEREMPQVKNGRFVLVPASDKTRGHQSLTQAVLWKSYVTELLGAEGK